MCGKTIIQTLEYDRDDVTIRRSGSRLRYILVVDAGPLSVQKVVPFCEPILVRNHTTAGPGKNSTYPVRPSYKNGPCPDPSLVPPVGLDCEPRPERKHPQISLVTWDVSASVYQIFIDA